MLAVSIKTFLRDDCLYNLVKSVKRYIPEARIYIADDGRMIEKKKEFYNKLEKEGHRVILLPFDVGLSAGRNAILDEVKEPYYINCDDDFEFIEKPNVKWCLEMLQKDDKLILVAGKVNDKLRQGDQQWGWNLTIKNRILYQDCNDNPTLKHQGIEYRFVDYVNNFFIAKTDLVRKIQWANEQRIGYEHIDFALRVKGIGYKKIVAPMITVEHKNKTHPEYHQRRRDFDLGILLKAWGLRKVLHPYNKETRSREGFATGSKK